MRDEYEQSLRRLLEEAQAAGLVRSDISAKFLGMVLFGMIVHIYPWYQPEVDVRPAELGFILADLFMIGVALRRPGTIQRLSGIDLCFGERGFGILCGVPNVRKILKSINPRAKLKRKKPKRVSQHDGTRQHRKAVWEFYLAMYFFGSVRAISGQILD